MYHVDGALIREQGVTFAIVAVKPYAIENSANAEEARRTFAHLFPSGVPIVLMAQDANGIPSYLGRKDIVDFLVNIDPKRIPWKQYTIDS